MWARLVSVLLSVWVVISVFFWPHNAQESMSVGLLCGTLLLIMSAASLVEPGVRFGAAFLGALLALYGLFGHHEASFTRWHDLVVGLLFVALAAVPSVPMMRHEVRPTRRVRT